MGIKGYVVTFIIATALIGSFVTICVKWGKVQEQLTTQVEVNAALRSTLSVHNSVTSAIVNRNNTLDKQVRTANYKLREALHNEPVHTQDSLDVPFSRPVTDALCLYHQAATTAARTSSPDSISGDTTTSEGTSTDKCEDWQGLTGRDVLEWSTDLVKHSGLEGSDKRGLREMKGKGMGKAE